MFTLLTKLNIKQEQKNLFFQNQTSKTFQKILFSYFVFCHLDYIFEGRFGEDEVG
jgi:hypothetical protein